MSESPGVAVGYYEDRVLGHPARVALVEAQELARRAAEVRFSGHDSAAPEHADAARAAIEDVVARLDLADTRLISEGMLTELSRPASRIRDFLNDLLSNPGSYSIRDVQLEVERLLTAARGLPPSPWQEDPAVVRAAAQRFRDRLAGFRRDAEQMVHALRTEGAAAAADLRSQQSELESQLQQLQSQARASGVNAEGQAVELDGRLAELRNQTEQAASNVKQLFSGLDERFASSQERRTERFEEAVREHG